MSSAGSRAKASASSVTDGSMTCSMNTPSPGWAATATNASPSPPSVDACARAINEPPPELPRSTTAAAPRSRTNSTAVVTSTTQFSCRQSVSLLTYRVAKPRPTAGRRSAPRSRRVDATAPRPSATARPWEASRKRHGPRRHRATRGRRAPVRRSRRGRRSPRASSRETVVSPGRDTPTRHAAQYRPAAWARVGYLSPSRWSCCSVRVRPRSSSVHPRVRFGERMRRGRCSRPGVRAAAPRSSSNRTSHGRCPTVSS